MSSDDAGVLVPLPLPDAAEQQLRAKAVAANSIHEAKIKTLMASISRLERENFKLKQASADYRRIDRFKKCQDELGRQDVMITALTKLVTDESALRDLFSRVSSIGVEQLETSKSREELVRECDHVSRHLNAAKQGLLLLQKQQEHAAHRSVAKEEEHQPRSTAMQELQDLAQGLAVQEQQLTQVAESLRKQRDGLERALAQQEEVALQTQRDSILKTQERSAVPNREVASDLEARLALRTAEAERARETVLQLRRRLQSMEAVAANLHQEQMAADEDSRRLKAKAAEDERQRQHSYRQQLQDQEQAVEAQARQLEQKRAATKQEKDAWRAQMKQWDADLNSAKEKLLVKEEESIAALESKVKRQIEASKAEHRGRVHLELQAAEIAEETLHSADAVCNRVYDELAEARSQHGLCSQKAAALNETLQLLRGKRVREEDLWEYEAPAKDVDRLSKELQSYRSEFESAESTLEEVTVRERAIEERRKRKATSAEVMASCIAELAEAEQGLDNAVLSKAQDLKQILTDINRLQVEVQQPLEKVAVEEEQPDSERLPWPVNILLAGVRAALRKRGRGVEEPVLATHVVTQPHWSPIAARGTADHPHRPELHQPGVPMMEAECAGASGRAAGEAHAGVLRPVPPEDVLQHGAASGISTTSAPKHAIAPQTQPPSGVVQAHTDHRSDASPLQQRVDVLEPAMSTASPGPCYTLPAAAQPPLTAVSSGQQLPCSSSEVAAPAATETAPRHGELRVRLADVKKAISQEESRTKEAHESRQRLEQYSLELEEDIRHLQMQLTAARVFMRRTAQGSGASGAQRALIKCKGCGYVGY
mmetsp:Transcript_3086/g.6941  ORF Transcript_3086/g.6941 Transcript_3086/m.6941 type:complete len:826 (+) Transcript_3086:72-2549(+)